ncbi:MAG: SRPBCC family protein [Euryarchaeota archaeon]|nr:SRPBCC family protein [Euryarchaeota archaeon]
MTNTQTAAKTGTVRVSRIIKAPAERVYKAFLDADAMAKWMPPGGYTGRFDPVDARVGGGFHGSFTSLDKKESHSFGGTYLELEPYSRIVHTDKFETDHPDMQNEMRVTVTFEEVEGGTEVKIVQENVPAMIPVEDATTGWNMSLDNLARLVEIPGHPDA